MLNWDHHGRASLLDPDPEHPRTCQVCGQVETTYYMKRWQDSNQRVEESRAACEAGGDKMSSHITHNVRQKAHWDLSWGLWAGRLICPTCNKLRGDAEKLAMLFCPPELPELEEKSNV